MTELPDFPRAHHVARAIVEAARAVEEDPIGVAQGDLPSRARPYAYLALRRLFPRPLGTDILRRLGGDTGKSGQARMYNAQQRSWWRLEVVEAIVAAVAAQPAPAAPVPSAPPAAPLEPRPRPASQDSWGGRIDPRPGISITAELLGDPAPVRSALTERQSRVIALWQEKHDTVEISRRTGLSEAGVIATLDAWRVASGRAA